MIDAAVILCLGRWIRRLRPFSETKLAKRVVLKTDDSAFNLEAIIHFLHRNVNHRNFPIFTRLAPLRPVPPGQKYWLGCPTPGRFASAQTSWWTWTSTRRGPCSRSCNLEWVTGWSLQQGLRRLADEYPAEQDLLVRPVLRVSTHRLCLVERRRHHLVGVGLGAVGRTCYLCSLRLCLFGVKDVRSDLVLLCVKGVRLRCID